MQRAVAAQQRVDSRATTEVGQVRATAHADVLAVVNKLARGRVGERTGPPAKLSPRLEQLDTATVIDQRRSCRKPGESAANDRHRGSKG
jgi:hypothetical protein